MTECHYIRGTPHRHTPFCDAIAIVSMDDTEEVVDVTKNTILEIVCTTPRKQWNELLYSAVICDQVHIVDYMCTLDMEINLVYEVPKRYWQDIFLFALRFAKPKFIYALYSLGFQEPEQYPNIIKELLDEISESSGNTQLVECLRAIVRNKQRSPVKESTTRHWKMKYRSVDPKDLEPRGIPIPFERK